MIVLPGIEAVDWARSMVPANDAGVRGKAKILTSAFQVLLKVGLAADYS